MLSIARSFRNAFNSLGNLVSVDKVAEAIKTGKNPASGIDFGHYRQILRKPLVQVGELRQRAGHLGAKKINGAFAARGMAVRFTKDDQFNFDSFSPAVQQQIRQSQDALIQQLESDARDSIATIIADGQLNGTSVADMASNIANMIGLTDRQAQAVLNYQRMLMNLDPTALQRALRDTDYDALYQDAIDAGKDLSDAAIEEMVQSYVDNYLDYRAATIAQTEATRAANAGIHDAYRQAIDRGALTDESVTRIWQLGDSPCIVCESIPDMNPDGVGVDEDFDSIDGPQTDPPDPHPNCMCSVDFVTDLTKI